MTRDTMLLKSVAKLINSGTSVERSIWEAGASVAEMLQILGGFMAERATDVLDVRDRVVSHLRGDPAPGIPASEAPFILVAEDLVPADTATLDPDVVLALVTSGGGPQSHTAIIARSLGRPVVVAAPGVDELPDGTEVFVDGAAGGITLFRLRSSVPGPMRGPKPPPPSPSLTATARRRTAIWSRSSPNVGGAKDAVVAAALGAQGVGLFRTEFCFLERDTEPSVEEQAAAYQGVFNAFPGKKVVLRTLDAGADKPLPFLTDSTEPNPALGARGYRTDFTNMGVLERQLQPIAQAASSSSADVCVMAPMISTSEEAARFAPLCAAAGLLTPGVMVEVPSAALTTASVLGQVSFASIGTNDLTLYAMAADRQLGPMAQLNSLWQPAVLRLIQLTVAGAAEEGSAEPVGVCGEAAADPALAVVLVDLGISTLSMTSRSLAAVGTVLKSVTLCQAQELARLALTAPDAVEAEAWVRAKLPILEELGL